MIIQKVFQRDFRRKIYTQFISRSKYLCGTLFHVLSKGVWPGKTVPRFKPLKRTRFLEMFADVRPVLEIGPFDRPIVKGDGVAYFDVLDQTGLIERGKSSPGRNGTVPFIHYVSASADLTIVDETFAAVCSAHTIEHQPDLVKHLCDVAKILEDGGIYYLAIPDKRYCFDHFGPLSSIADAIEAQGRTVHTMANVIWHTSLFTHNDAVRHWAGDHENPGHRADIAGRVAAGARRYENAKGTYIDVHGWRFTPHSFLEITGALHELGLSPLAPREVYDTPLNRGEFMAVLEKTPDRRA